MRRLGLSLAYIFGGTHSYLVVIICFLFFYIPSIGILIVVLAGRSYTFSHNRIVRGGSRGNSWGSLQHFFIQNVILHEHIGYFTKLYSF